MNDQYSLFVLAVALPAVLLAAYVIGQLARWVVRRRVSLGVSTMIVVSVVGISCGLLLTGLISRNPRVLSVETFLFSLGCTVVLLGLLALVASRFQPFKHQETVFQLISRGESKTLEFKSSARWNLHSGQRDERIEAIIAKAVAGFLNAMGGTLLIGVNDEGELVGLERDFTLIKKPDIDRYELWLRDFLSATLGQNASTLVGVDFEPIEVSGRPTFICRVSCPHSPLPVFLRPIKTDRSEFWVRTGNSTRQLGMEEAAGYIGIQWPLGVGRTLAAQIRSAFRGDRIGR